VNAKTLKKMLGGKNSKRRKRKRKKRPIATVFFRFSHRDKDGNPLRNKSQSSIIEVIKNDVISKQKAFKIEEEKELQQIEDEIRKETEELNKEEDILNKEDDPKPLEAQKKISKFEEYQSNTYIPYYDKIPRDTNDLGEDEFELINVEDIKECKSEPSGSDLEKDEERKASFDPKPLRLPKSENLHRFVPIMSEKSKIMTELQIILIARLLPPLFRTREWKKVFSVDEDGVSLQTFYKNANNYSNAILFIEDNNGYKFGAYTTEDWAIHKHFYGTGESFLFTFRDTEEDIEFYKWSGYNDHIQYSDEESIAVGGADGKFALYLRSNFYQGISNQ
jgi:hypothetical protein